MKSFKLVFICLIFSIIFQISVNAEDLKVIGLSPINQSTCLSDFDKKIIYYTISTNSSENETFLFYILDLDWVYVNSSIDVTPRSAKEIPFYLIPENIPEANYTTRIWICLKEKEANITGYSVRNCLEGNINIEISEKCRISGKDPMKFLIPLALVTIFIIVYLVRLKIRGK